MNNTNSDVEAVVDLLYDTLRERYKSNQQIPIDVVKQMAEGIISEVGSDGTQPRQVLMSMEQSKYLIRRGKVYILQ